MSSVTVTPAKSYTTCSIYKFIEHVKPKANSATMAICNLLKTRNRNMLYTCETNHSYIRISAKNFNSNTPVIEYRQSRLRPSKKTPKVTLEKLDHVEAFYINSPLDPDILNQPGLYVFTVDTYSKNMQPVHGYETGYFILDIQTASFSLNIDDTPLELIAVNGVDIMSSIKLCSNDISNLYLCQPTQNGSHNYALSNLTIKDIRSVVKITHPDICFLDNFKHITHKGT